jgi:hypothetical protein
MKTIDNYTLGDLVKEVKKRFGSIHNFNRLTGRKPHALYNIENRGLSQKRIDLHRTSIYNDIVEHEPKMLALDVSYRGLIYLEIYRRYKTVLKFSEANPEFDNIYISRIINGHRTKITMKTRKLLKTLNIDI